MGSGVRSRVKLTVAIAALMATLVLAVVPARAEFSIQSWKFFKDISLPDALPKTSLIEIEPDSEVFAHATPALSDLRIVENDSQPEVPYKLLVERGEQRRESVPVTMRDLGHIPSQETSFILDLNPQGRQHNELEINTQSHNFQRGIVVEGSEDADRWRVLDGSGQIFDFTIAERGFVSRDTRVTYPSSTVRYLKIRIINRNLPPLEVEGALVFFTQEIKPRQTTYTADILDRIEDPVENITKLVLDLGSAGFPTNRISLTTSQQNFYRQAKLEGSDDQRAWTLIRRSENLFNFNTPKFASSQLSVGYPESRYRYFRLTVFNEDDPPLHVTGAEASGFLRKLIFQANPGGVYRLYYGNPDAEAPSYELEYLFPYLITDNLPTAGLGAHTANPVFNLREPTKPFTERYPWLLPTVVALAALVIGVFLTSLFRQIKGMLPPPPTPPE